MKVLLSTGQCVHVDRDGISDISSADYKALPAEDQQRLLDAEDHASKKECGFELGRSSFDYIPRTAADDRRALQGA
ncbi:MAG: hypothetical protein M0Q93_00445 [Terrimicrobiaceae bacterium]|nr:hypothetical protein [Terrimicrobiaceae bacterium]